jgi:hypothetical protein
VCSLKAEAEGGGGQNQSVQGLHNEGEKGVEIAAENRAALVRLEQQMQDQAQHRSQQEQKDAKNRAALVRLEQQVTQKDGFLEKKGHFMKNWKRRYFVWTPADNAIRYYSESALQRTEKGPFCLRRN